MRTLLTGSVVPNTSVWRGWRELSARRRADSQAEEKLGILGPKEVDRSGSNLAEQLLFCPAMRYLAIMLRGCDLAAQSLTSQLGPAWAKMDRMRVDLMSSKTALKSPAATLAISVVAKVESRSI